MRSRPLSAIAALFSCLASAEGWAGDGVVEINQTCAIAASGCFQDDSGGFPVVITGAGGLSYRLTSDLVVPDPNTHGISIKTNDVSIDLGGFRIQGPNTCSGTPTTCTLNGVGSGIAVNDPGAVTGVEVSHGSVVGMGGSGILLGNFSAVRELRVSQSGANGIEVGENGIVSGSSASANLYSGITVGIDSHAANCTSSRNGLYGIRAYRGSSVSGCTASNNASIGIQTEEGTNVIGCTASSNQHGISTGSGSSVRDSVARNNSFHGILTGLGSAVSGSSAVSNGSVGIITTSGSTVSNSSSSLNGASGIQVGPGSLVIGSSTRDNADAGLYLGGDSAYRECVITSNTSGTAISTLNDHVNLGSNHCTDAADVTVACP